MQRRKFIAGLGSLTAAGAAGIGTGAFTSVEADRSVTVDTAADSDALLRFEATDDNANGGYASVDGNQVSIDFSGLTADSLEGGGTGVNENSTTTIYDIFTVENQGTQDAVVYVQPSSLKDDDAFDKSVDNLYLDPQFSDMPNSDDDTLGELPDGTKFGSLTGIGGSVEDFETELFESNSNVAHDAETFVLGPGESFDFGLYIKATGPVDEVAVDMTIEADAALADEVGE